LEIGLPWAPVCRASACADAAPSGSEGLRRLEIGLPGHRCAGRRPAPTPPPFGAGPLRRLEIGLPWALRAGRRPAPRQPPVGEGFAPIGNRPPMGASRWASASADAALGRRRPTSGHRP